MDIKRVMAVLILSKVFFYSGEGFAELIDKSPFFVGGEVSYIKYEEPGVMEEKGMMYGVSGLYTYRHSEVPLVLRADSKFSVGELDYTSARTGSIDNIDDYMLEVRGTAGINSRPIGKFVFMPYFGIGYRYLNDDSGGMTSTTCAKGYERESNYYYSPMGIEVTEEFKNGWSLAGIMEYDLFWSGKQKSRLSDIAGYGDIKNDQGNGYGMRSSIKIIKKSKNIELLFEAFIRYWDIGESDLSEMTYKDVIIGYGYEPENNSTEIGLKGGISF